LKCTSLNHSMVKLQNKKRKANKIKRVNCEISIKESSDGKS